MRVKQLASLAIFLLIIAFTGCGWSLAADGVLRSMEKEFIRIFDNVGPAIVEISATLSPLSAGSPTEEHKTEFDNEDHSEFKTIPVQRKKRVTPMEQFFATPLFPNRPNRTIVQENIGTGIIVNRSGYIVTTESVVGRASKIGVNMADGRTFEAKLVGSDSVTDIALIKIDAEELPVAALGNSDSVRAGSWVMGIGRSYGKSPTLSFSVVSGVEPLPGKPAYYDAIKINTSVSPGNSGGGVIDMDGKLVGIIAAVLAEPRAMDFQPYDEIAVVRKQMGQKGTTSVGNISLPLGDRLFWRKEESFAIPINFARNAIDDLIEYGKIRRGWLGVAIRSIGQEDMRQLGLDTTEAVIVSKIFDNSPAAKAGLRKGDVIISLDGGRIKRGADLVRMVAATEPYTRAVLDIMRDREKRTFSVEIGEMPSKP